MKRLRKPLFIIFACLLTFVFLLLPLLSIRAAAVNQDIGPPINHVQWDPQINIRVGAGPGGPSDYVVTLSPSYVSSSDSSTLANTTLNYEALQSDVDGSYYIRGFGGIGLFNSSSSKILTYRQCIGSTRDVTASLNVIVNLRDDLIIIPNPLFGLSSSSSIFEAQDVIFDNCSDLKEFSFQFYEQYNSELFVEQYTLRYDICFPSIEVVNTFHDQNASSDLIKVSGHSESGSHVDGDSSTDPIGKVSLIDPLTFYSIWESASSDEYFQSKFIALTNVNVVGELASRSQASDVSWDDRLVFFDISQPREYFSSSHGSVNLQSIELGNLYGSSQDFVALVSFGDFDLISWLTQTADAFFSMSIFGPVSIGDILWFVVGVSLFIVFLKMFAGG